MSNDLNDLRKMLLALAPADLSALIASLTAPDLTSLAKAASDAKAIAADSLEERIVRIEAALRSGDLENRVARLESYAEEFGAWAEKCFAEISSHVSAAHGVISELSAKVENVVSSINPLNVFEKILSHSSSGQNSRPKLTK